MADVYNAEEIMEMACQIERNGARYYRKAAKMIDDAAAQKLFLELAAMEDQHEKTFDTLRAQGAVLIEKLGNPDEEAAIYMRTLADVQLFPRDADPAEKIKAGMSVAEILSIAIGLEKDSVVFYTALRSMVPAELGQGKVQAIIAEELNHIRILSKKMLALTL